MKKFLLIVTFVMTINLFSAYNVGDTVDPDDNLSWTDNFGYSSNIFDEITNNQKVVLIFWGGET